MRSFILVLTIFLSSCSNAEENTNLLRKKIILSHNNKSVSIMVETAETVKEQEIGLMFRKSLSPNTGMLFNFKVKKVHKFWMKNTFIPLDIIFFNSNKIVGLVENAIPHNLTPLGNEQLSDKVLEVPAGFIKRYKITTKWKLLTLHRK